MIGVGGSEFMDPLPAYVHMRRHNSLYDGSKPETFLRRSFLVHTLGYPAIKVDSRTDRFLLTLFGFG